MIFFAESEGLKLFLLSHGKIYVALHQFIGHSESVSSISSSKEWI